MNPRPREFGAPGDATCAYGDCCHTTSRMSRVPSRQQDFVISVEQIALHRYLSPGRLDRSRTACSIALTVASILSCGDQLAIRWAAALLMICKRCRSGKTSFRILASELTSPAGNTN